MQLKISCYPLKIDYRRVTSARCQSRRPPASILPGRTIRHLSTNERVLGEFKNPFKKLQPHSEAKSLQIPAQKG